MFDSSISIEVLNRLSIVNSFFANDSVCGLWCFRSAADGARQKDFVLRNDFSLFEIFLYSAIIFVKVFLVETMIDDPKI
jgi:hypothetical protein